MFNRFLRLILISDVEYSQTDPLNETSNKQNGKSQGLADA